MRAISPLWKRGKWDAKITCHTTIVNFNKLLLRWLAFIARQ